MSVSSESSSVNIYEERLNKENTLDLSSQELESLPELKNSSLAVLYLQNNKLKCLPDDFFQSLPNLTYLDLRDNRLTEIPSSIKNHNALTHLLLQNNCITALPNELGTIRLKLLQLNGNPLTYPPREVISKGVNETLKYLNTKFSDENLSISQELSETSDLDIKNQTLEAISYNSVIDVEQFKVRKDYLTDEEFYAKFKGKCPKLAMSRHKNLPPYYQSAKYLKPLLADGAPTREEKIKQSYLKDLAIKKRRDLLATREKILQERKNLELLKNWRKQYRYRQCFNQYADYKLGANDYPYDTTPEYMRFLTREDIEKDLPDKYRKSLTRRAKTTVPRKSNADVHLAIKIKKLFENLETIDLNRDKMTPRTEQKVLLNEIHKISEIKNKLKELSTANMGTVISK